MASPEQICRLCLDESADNFVALDNIKIEMLEKISLNLGISLMDNPLVCSKCRDTLQRSYDFKMTCLANCNVKLEPEEIVETNEVGIGVKHEKESVCRFCLRPMENDYFVKFIEDEDIFFGEMLRRCLPEVECSATNQPFICFDCMSNCQDMFNFVINCSNNDGKLENTQSNFSAEYIFEIKNDNTFEDTLTSIKQETDRENLDPTSCDIVMKKEEFEQLEDHEINIKNEDDIPLEDDTTTELKSFSAQENATSTEKSSSNVKVRKCTECSYETKCRRNLYRHKQVHKDISEGMLHTCTECSYKSRHKRYLQAHLLTHKDNSKVATHKCTECGYESKSRRNYQRHVLVHERGSELTVHKCTVCRYKTKYKLHLQRHMLAHKDKSEVTMHKCPECSYESGLKCYLKKHMLNHKLDVTMHKCTECSFETRYKYNFRTHMLTHKDKSEVAMYKCMECSYETYLSCSIRRHMLMHRDKSEVTMHKCTECSFESKYKGCLRKHLLIHKREQEILMGAEKLSQT